MVHLALHPHRVVLRYATGSSIWLGTPRTGTKSQKMLIREYQRHLFQHAPTAVIHSHDPDSHSRSALYSSGSIRSPHGCIITTSFTQSYCSADVAEQEGSSSLWTMNGLQTQMTSNIGKIMFTEYGSTPGPDAEVSNSSLHSLFPTAAAQRLIFNAVERHGKFFTKYPYLPSPECRLARRGTRARFVSRSSTRLPRHAEHQRHASKGTRAISATLLTAGMEGHFTHSHCRGPPRTTSWPATCRWEPMSNLELWMTTVMMVFGIRTTNLSSSLCDNKALVFRISMLDVAGSQYWRPSDPVQNKINATMRKDHESASMEPRPGVCGPKVLTVGSDDKTVIPRLLILFSDSICNITPHQPCSAQPDDHSLILENLRATRYRHSIAPKSLQDSCVQMGSPTDRHIGRTDYSFFPARRSFASEGLVRPLLLPPNLEFDAYRAPARPQPAVCTYMQIWGRGRVGSVSVGYMGTLAIVWPGYAQPRQKPNSYLTQHAVQSIRFSYWKRFGKGGTLYGSSSGRETNYHAQILLSRDSRNAASSKPPLEHEPDYLAWFETLSSSLYIGFNPDFWVAHSTREYPVLRTSIDKTPSIRTEFPLLCDAHGMNQIAGPNTPLPPTPGPGKFLLILGGSYAYSWLLAVRALSQNTTLPPFS
ncbi:uncharacterized protein CLUP02_15229 [Colletotrichum lupini]|uniref:Uncharacterized protein n=1 Tax=Colletotrichum lupini TaxID=145971 RepID=A0A9Q8T5P2_9PEZI|nr:uncharacterized protein CLUP02_15229 [Colletotrichum lupini]UQC89698.1 hypothetical protein CLUP02_15229 [Colletotrichum lupini]